MKIHEYQGKAILKTFGVPVPQGDVAFNADDARAIAAKLIAETGNSVVVVKAQIHAGGRGKGGGVKVVKSADEARDAAARMIGMKLVTYQTGPEGSVVSRVLVEQGLQIARELYLGVVIDRSTQMPVVMVSQDGGVEIEKVAHETPERIFKAFVNPALGLQAFQARQLAFDLGLSGDQVGRAVKMMMALYRAFVSSDASLLEINPLIVTGTGDLLALDAKVNFDDNALFRHAEFKELRDLGEEAPLEVEASKFSLNYIKLDGTIGCMVNGAGLAMATMDIIKLAGGEPANFLDVGGGANAEQIKNAFRIPDVR
jgi:succinyl-CoA synthetase beta subunit